MLRVCVDLGLSGVETVTVKIGAADDLEHVYMAKFRAFAAAYGTFVEYAADRAARDIGLHFTQLTAGGGRVVTPALVWFQMKGISAARLSLETFEAAETVSLPLQTDHLRFWYVAPESTYLVIYIESADQFLVFNVKDWVSEQQGDAILTSTQKTHTVKVDKKNLLDDHAFRIMLRKNLVSVVRDRLRSSDDRDAQRFLAASEVVKWMNVCREAGLQTRVSVRSWITKTRTEVAFLSRKDGDDDWQLVRQHWQFMMPTLTETFPFLSFSGGRQARFITREHAEEYDGEIYVEVLQSIEWLDDDVADEMDDEEIEGEGWLDLGEGVANYGDVAGGEYVEHELDIALNVLGETWLANLKIMEAAEILVVGDAEGWVSVAPWHARDL